MTMLNMEHSIQNKKMEQNTAKKQSVTPRANDYSQWYLDIIAAADLADSSPVRGCMVIKPYGYALWENMQKILDGMFKETGVQNAYFPLFIPVSFLTKEAKHVEGFAPEVAVVTHHRLRADKNGVLQPEGKLEEPLVVRPTSETIMYASYAKWIQSWRDLPLLINQWANVVRWELRTRPFLRTMEFLWQEGHTAHATKQEADERTTQMLEVYRRFAEEYMAMPVVAGRKTESEKFAGAEYTTCIEAMMQDGKALQAGTSHMLGQNFAKAFDVKFLDPNGETQFVWQTSWGVSTRLIGAIIMQHSDDKGLVLPPKLAPIQVVIVPIWTGDDERQTVFNTAEEISKQLKQADIAVHVDKRDDRPGPKFFEWEKKGVPLRLEVGPKDIASNSIVVVRRDTGEKQTATISSGISSFITDVLTDIQTSLFNRAAQFKKDNTRDVAGWEEFRQVLEEKGGFLRAYWCDDAACEAAIKETTKATIRCVPFDQAPEIGACVKCGGESSGKVIFAKAY